jgi:hypothetical protein
MNGYLLGSLLGPFAGMSDEERDEAYKRIEPNDEDAVKRLISTTLKPNFDRQDDQSQAVLRENLSYFLTAGSDFWRAIYEMYMPPIDPPDDPRQFFVWLWEVLFPGEDYVMGELSDVKVVNDIDALSALRTRRV